MTMTKWMTGTALAGAFVGLIMGCAALDPSSDPTDAERAARVQQAFDWKDGPEGEVIDLRPYPTPCANPANCAPGNIGGCVDQEQRVNSGQCTVYPAGAYVPGVGVTPQTLVTSSCYVTTVPCTGGTCSPGLTMCGSRCTNLRRDDNNCGSCGRSCGSVTTSICIEGNCVPFPPPAPTTPVPQPTATTRPASSSSP